MLRFVGLPLILGLLLPVRARADDPFATDSPDTTTTTAPAPPPPLATQAGDPFATESPGTDAAPPPPMQLRHRAPHDFVTIDIGFVGQDYSEIIASPPGAKSGETGALPGFHVAWEHLFGQGFSLSASLDGWFGPTTYNGSAIAPSASGSSATVSPLIGPTDNRILHAELLGGYRLRDPHGETWHAYGGLAYQDWLRDMRPMAAGYREQYDWFMLVVGIEYVFFHTAPWEISADLSARWNVGGAIDVRLSDIPAAQWTDIVTSLGMAFGVRVQLPIHFRCNDLVSIEAVPFFEYMPIGQSPTNVTVSRAEPSLVGVGYEPSSNTFLAGLLIGPRFAF